MERALGIDIVCAPPNARDGGRAIRSILRILVCLTLACAAARADTLAQIVQRGSFVWGADQEGGGLYAFLDAVDPSQPRGCDVDLAQALARELTREFGRPIEARFAQGQWDKLPELLETGRIDLVLNGFEWMPERAQRMRSTIPYYVFELQLLVRADAGASGWDWLRTRPAKRVGVLGGSAAERYLAEHEPGLELVSYDGSTNAMGDVASGRLDATLQDLPIAIYYRRNFPSLEPAGELVGAGRYVIYVRRTDAALCDALDRAIRSLRADGTLEAIYTRYDCWNAAQLTSPLLELPRADVQDSRSGAGESSFLARHASTLLQAAGMTVLLSLASFPLAIALGILVALGRRYGPRWVSWPLGVYVEVLRGTPLMLQLFVLFYVLPNAGLRLDALLAAVLGLAINYSAYEAEIYRAGLQAVPPGQMEAALALGMSQRLALRRIVLPQAVRIVIPATTNDFIALFKDTSVCSVITVVELTKSYNIAAMNNPADVLPLAVLAGLLYLAMSYPLSLLSSRLEARLRR
ncbi:MAG: ABC transporter permease subunit [Planctomycetes bacterium]|nr:ABC transporter permease subunit [Planctomycetota bacterium]